MSTQDRFDNHLNKLLQEYINSEPGQHGARRHITNNAGIYLTTTKRASDRPEGEQKFLDLVQTFTKVV